VTGPESTGKTTLAAALAESLRAPLVEEVARRWLAQRGGDQRIARPAKVDSHGRSSSTETADRGRQYNREDVLEIAREQLEAERVALATGAPVIVADTDLTVIQVWWEEQYGELDAWILAELQRRTPRRYLLTLPDIPWESDPLRESPHDRERLLERYRELLASSDHPYAEIDGLGQTRFERALAQVQRWLAG